MNMCMNIFLTFKKNFCLPVFATIIVIYFNTLVTVLQLIEIVGAVMDRSRMKDMFANSYDKILIMYENEVTICKVCK